MNVMLKITNGRLSVRFKINWSMCGFRLNREMDGLAVYLTPTPLHPVERGFLAILPHCIAEWRQGEVTWSGLLPSYEPCPCNLLQSGMIRPWPVKTMPLT